jgi:hypothetical protein
MSHRRLSKHVRHVIRHLVLHQCRINSLPEVLYLMPNLTRLTISHDIRFLYQRPVLFHRTLLPQAERLSGWLLLMREELDGLTRLSDSTLVVDLLAAIAVENVNLILALDEWPQQPRPALTIELSGPSSTLGHLKGIVSPTASSPARRTNFCR